MNIHKKDIIIIGCGCIGLSAGVILLKTGDYNVKIWAKDLPPNTTSNKAAALWYPFLSEPLDKVGRWSQETMDYFKKEIIPLGVEKTGTLTKKVYELYRTPRAQLPEWSPFVPSFRRMKKEEMLDGYIDGFTVEDGFVMDTDQYMDWLVESFKALGGSIDQREVVDIREPFIYADIVINCSGLGARELIGDRLVYPSRGQIIVVDNTRDISLMDEEDEYQLGYVIPRVHNSVLGGTNQQHNYNLEPSKKDTEEILDRVAKISPQFERKNLKILGEKVGLRPSRYSIRLENEFMQDGRKLLVHNYGHGGSGFTVSWGCALDTLKLVRKGADKLKTSNKSDVPWYSLLNKRRSSSSCSFVND
ncbi:D-aspartate oxidase [Heterostelium album PN500]|uniref:D-aspartate oxidase n=1 Tax=Heterostelium pallidum (strain ATCC 26659 / Pp 5 / PN500) TaxID=670386 RepID=D3AVR2_HETP5|nr:D-aspartate oxidase [Heterostelium album PN500]EFA86385.1 D-aspartate oxidase [Heterostelium album PN500]|eukprot:XP_020438490.1 D-aspartate oxidase [Heterostelium album PN500]